MRLYLLRHGIAGKADAIKYPDDDRPLTEEGIEKMCKAAAGICAAIEDVEQIVSSPLLRARQTAQIIAEKLDRAKDLRIENWLTLGESPKVILERIAAENSSSMLLDGHEPELVGIFCTVTGARGGSIDLKKGGLIGLEVHRFSPYPSGTLLFHLMPKQLR